MQIIKNLEKLGYDPNDVLGMTVKAPNLLSNSIDTINRKKDTMMSFGYSEEEVIKATTKAPKLFSSSMEGLKARIDFYDSVDMHELFVLDPLNLITSPELAYARYMFYADNGINIDMSNYKKLFINSKQFEKSYGLTSEDLKEKYKYEERVIKDDRTL